MYLQPMNIDNQIWPSAEHYYQAQKFAHLADIYNQICSAKSGVETRSIAQKYKAQRRADWDDVKEDLLFTSMKLKFSTLPEMKKKLLETGDAYLEKSVPDDPFWGVLPDGTGQNMMGKMLMQIRDDLKNS